MKQGTTLNTLAATLLRQAQLKRDYLVDTRALRFEAGAGGESKITLMAEEPEAFLVNDFTHRQIADRLGIPARYFDMMREKNPELLGTNVNSWFAAKPEKRLLRTLDGTARAFLSDRYRRMDNAEVAEAVLPIISELPEAEVISCELTQTKMYIKVVNRRLQLDVRPGDTVQAGFVLSNSEVGAGSVRVEPLVFRLVCSNGLIVPDYGQKRYHVGRALEAEESQAIYRDETLAADDAAFLMKVQDTVRLAVDQAKFAHLVNRLRDAAGEPLSGNPVSAVELMANRHALTQDESGGVLRHLVTGGDFSRYGLLNAVTRTSQEVADYDRATELERLGGKIMTLDTKEWRELSVAA